tara:strand:- start:101 stop:418 length:318 start_codon:yes stop_codon:yes gene_type:complete
MNNILKSVNKLCLPAQLYLAISTLSVLGLLFQNMGMQNKYCIGHLSTDLPCNNMVVFIGKVLYILVWTWILQKLCKKGYKSVSWLIVLFPYVLMFLVLLLMMLAI